jgi:hypothetical protein
MSFDVSVVLETVVGSALGAGATFVGIWFLFFRARVEHLQAISAPNLAKELQGVSQMLDQSVKEKQELEQRFIEGIEKVLPNMLKGPINGAVELARLVGKLEGAQEAVLGLQKTILNYIAAVKTGAEPPIPGALSSGLLEHLDGFIELMSQNTSAAELKRQNLLAELERMGKG